MRRRSRAALVTGATSGIGEAFARALPGETGLLLTGRNRDPLRKLSRELSFPGRPVEAVATDLSTDGGLDALTARAEASQVELLILNAGTGRFGDFLEAPEAALRDAVAVNVTAPALLARRLLRGMLARELSRGCGAGRGGHAADRAGTGPSGRAGGGQGNRGEDRPKGPGFKPDPAGVGQGRGA